MKKSKKTQNGPETFILSVIIAIVVWFVIGFIQDPDIRGTFTDISVQYSGLDVLAEKGMVLSMPPMNSAASSVVLSGKRYDLIEYSDGITLNIDVSEITAPGKYSLAGNIKLPNSQLSIIKENTALVTINVEKLSEKDVPVEIRQTGASKAGLVQSETETASIRISGAESELQLINAAYADIDVSAVAEDVTLDLPIRLESSSGTPLPHNTTVTPSLGFISVKNTVYEKKTLPVKLKLSEKYENSFWLDEEESVISTPTVEVGVLADCKADCVYAVINSDAGDKTSYPLIETDGMYIPEENSDIRIKPALIPKVSRHINAAVTAENVAQGLNAEFPDTLSGILVNAPEDTLNAGNISAVIDLSNLGVGTHHVKAEFKDKKITPAEDLYVDVVIKQ